MPKFTENCQVFYRFYDGKELDVNFAERREFMTVEQLAAKYGGDGTLQGSGQAFFDSLDKVGGEDIKTKVKDKRMVYFWAKKDGAVNVHETLAAAGQAWATLPAAAATGYYPCKH